MSGSNSSGLSRRVGTVPKSLRSKSAHAAAALTGVTLSSRFKLRSISVSRASISSAGPSCWVSDVTCQKYPPACTGNLPVSKRRRSRLSVECDDDLAGRAALLGVRQRVEGLVKRERLVDDRAEVAGVVKGGQLAQLSAVGLHEQERVAHSELPGLLVDLSAQQPHHDTNELRRAELLREPGVRRASHADRVSAGLEDGEGLLEVLAAEGIQHD